MKFVSTSDFSHYFTNKTDQVVAASIANEAIEKVLKHLLKDPTLQANGEFAEGYRSCLQALERDLKEKFK